MSIERHLPEDSLVHSVLLKSLGIQVRCSLVLELFVRFKSHIHVYFQKPRWIEFVRSTIAKKRPSFGTTNRKWTPGSLHFAVEIWILWITIIKWPSGRITSRFSATKLIEYQRPWRRSKRFSLGMAKHRIVCLWYFRASSSKHIPSSF